MLSDHPRKVGERKQRNVLLSPTEFGWRINNHEDSFARWGAGPLQRWLSIPLLEAASLACRPSWPVIWGSKVLLPISSPPPESESLSPASPKWLRNSARQEALIFTRAQPSG